MPTDEPTLSAAIQASNRISFEAGRATKKCHRLHLDPATKKRLRHRASKQIDVLGVNHDVGAMVLGILSDIIDDEIDADAERRFANQSIDPDPLRAIAEEQQRQERKDYVRQERPPTIR